jgi:hypothetical protein
MKRVASVAAALLVGMGLSRALRADEPASSAPAPVPASTPSSSGASSRREDRLAQRLERLRQHALELASALPVGSAAPLPSGSATPVASLAQGQELLQRWAELAATRQARREQHRAELQRELGELAADPEIAAELRLHAQRLSDLSRVEFLAKNARSGHQREQLLARVSKLLAREAGRHHQALARLARSKGKGKATDKPSGGGTSP